MSDDHDPFLDLCERFAARGVQLKQGNIREDMLKHLLDSLEEVEANVRGVADRVRKLLAERAVTNTPGDVTPDG